MSIYTEGFGHDNPIPVASKIGPYLASGVLTGRDPDTQQLPADLDSQVANVFTHIRNVMQAAGGSPDDILKLNVHMVEYRNRAALNEHWQRMFPDPASRPARQVMAATLDRGALIQADLLAIIDEAR
ncbi:RidA family protein [Enteractinococcus helveticum]|uniref:RidA family protein n=1 Tax=Enteractinococcus helveticum TaxID=1837282 RepID=UPI001F1EFCB8|nr:RidA family protein [Enteractinococcus helveticum]